MKSNNFIFLGEQMAPPANSRVAEKSHAIIICAHEKLTYCKLENRGRLMFAAGNSVFSPDDVTVLRGALDEWCLEKRIDIKSTEAQFAATAALGLFQSGYNTSEKLLAALREHRGI